jgi:DNA polymerase-3 subunit gamma/tau
VVQVASNWIGMVQSRLPLLEKAMEATLGSARTITLEAGDQDRPAPAATAAPAPPRVSAPEQPAPVNSTEPAPEREPVEPAAAGIATTQPCPPAKSEEMQPPQTTDQRLLEESTGLLADFFNGEIIQGFTDEVAGGI